MEGSFWVPQFRRHYRRNDALCPRFYYQGYAGDDVDSDDDRAVCGVGVVAERDNDKT
jgi:hypothetical protein